MYIHMSVSYSVLVATSEHMSSVQVHLHLYQPNKHKSFPAVTVSGMVNKFSTWTV